MGFDVESIGMTLPEQPTAEQLLSIIGQLQERIVALEAENAALREQLNRQGPKRPALSDLPHFIKPNKPKKEAKERKGRRQRVRGYSRPASTAPTRTETLAVDNCPDCGRSLSGGWLHAAREVIDILPAVTEVVQYLFTGRRCGVCKKRRLPRSQETLAASGATVLGQHRFGVRLASLIAHLKTAGRMSVRTIQKLLRSLFGLTISTGGIVDLLEAVAEAGKKTYDTLLSDLRASPFVHADETGWREDGINGYLWSFSTPTIRVFVRDQSRSHEIPERVLGSDFRGILCSDFYSGYHYHLGEHQRCWVHLLRDNHNLKAAFADVPDAAGVRDWCDRLYALYEEATSSCWLRKQDRVREREALQRKLVALARPYADAASTDVPQATLAARLLRHEPEMFTFVEHPQVPSDNNAAERAIRPAVIARKVSGGTRSSAGSDTFSVLMSLFGTWQARGLDPLTACVDMLRNNA